MKYTTFDKLTVGQYQELYQINRGEDDDLDKSIAFVAVLTGLTRWEVEELPLSDFNKVAKEIGTIFSEQPLNTKLRKSFVLFGKKYRVIYNIRKLTTGQYIDLQHFISGNVIENLHKIIACLIIPVSWWSKEKYDAENHEIISEGVQDLNFMEVNAICVFFLSLWSNSIKALEPYLLNQIQRKGMTLSRTDLQKIMHGYTMQNESVNLKV